MSPYHLQTAVMSAVLLALLTACNSDSSRPSSAKAPASPSATPSDKAEQSAPSAEQQTERKAPSGGVAAEPLLTLERIDRIQTYLEACVKDPQPDESFRGRMTYFLRDLEYTAEQLPALDAWCKKRPDSFLPFLVRGKHHVKNAWRARGSGWANTVTSQGWGEFRRLVTLAKADLEQAHALNPKDPHAATALVQVAMAQGLPEPQLEAYFQQAIAADPTHFSAYYNKLESLRPRWGGSLPKLFAFARKSAAEAPPQSRVEMLMIDAHGEGSIGVEGYWARADVWNEVKAAYEKTLAKQPGSGGYDLNKFAQYALRCKQHAFAARLFDRIGVNWLSGPWSADFNRYMRSRARAYHPGESNGNPWTEGGFVTEVEWYIKAATTHLAQKPADAWVLFSRGVAYGLRARTPEAMGDFAAAERLEPNWPLLYYTRARHYHDILQDYEKSAAYFQRAVSINPNYRNARRELGIALKAQKKYEEALKCFEACARQTPSDRFTRMHAAETCSLLEKYEAGLVHARAGLKYSMGKNDKKWAKSFIDSILWFDNKLERPRELLKDNYLGVQLLPDDSKYYNGVAWQLARSKDESLRNPRMALAPAQKAVELTQQRKEPYLHTLAIVYEELKMTAEAQAVWQQILVIEPDNKKAKNKTKNLGK